MPANNNINHRISSLYVCACIASCSGTNRVVFSTAGASMKLSKEYNFTDIKVSRSLLILYTIVDPLPNSDQ